MREHRERQLVLQLLDVISGADRFTIDFEGLWRQVQVLTQPSLDRNLQERVFRLLSEICNPYDTIPAYLGQREAIHIRRARFHGGLADVRDEEYLGFPVALKHIKIYRGDSDKVLMTPSTNLAHSQPPNQRLCREIIDWKHLNHKNILPLLGVPVTVEPAGEWMPNENDMQYVRSNPKANDLRLVSPLAVSSRCSPLLTDNLLAL